MLLPLGGDIIGTPNTFKRIALFLYIYIIHTVSFCAKYGKARQIERDERQKMKF